MPKYRISQKTSTYTYALKWLSKSTPLFTSISNSTCSSQKLTGSSLSSTSYTVFYIYVKCVLYANSENLEFFLMG